MTRPRARRAFVRGVQSHDVAVTVERAPKELAAWAKVVVPAGGTAQVSITVPASAFRRWNEDAGSWTIDPGTYELLVGASAGDIRQRLALVVR